MAADTKREPNTDQGHGHEHCPVCHTEAVGLMGYLGKLAWYRCRDCGFEWYEDSLRMVGRLPYYPTGE